MAAVALGVGLLLGLVTSGGIAGERITRGAIGAALVANAAVTLVALFAIVPTMRRMLVSFGDGERARTIHPLVVLVPQIVGAAAGIFVVHFVLRREALGALPWLSERPAQLVNDAVAAAGLLALVWASANDLDPRVLVIAFIGVTLYRLTSPLWHLDAATFHTSVQELIVAQLVAAALALGLFRTALNGAR